MSDQKTFKDRYKKLKIRTEKILKTELGEARRVEGLQNNNWVFITCDGKKPYLFKFIKEEELDRLEVEIAICKYLNDKTDLPVPRTIKYEKDRDNSYLLRTVIEGQVLKEELKTCQNPAELFYKAGKWLAELHSIEFEEKGILNEDLAVRPYDLFNQEEYLQFLDIIYKNDLLNDDQYSLLKKVDISFYYDYRPYVLCHSDYSLNNLIAKDGELVGIIDFEWASAVPFMDDAAAFDLFVHIEGYQEYLTDFYQGYQKIHSIPDFYFEHLEFYKFYRLITMLSYQVNAEDVRFEGEFHNWMKNKLKTVLESDLFL